MSRKIISKVFLEVRLGKAIKPEDLKGNDPIVARIARHEGVERYDHGRPADVLLREREAILSQLSEDTLKRFEDLFVRINKTLVKSRNAA